MSCSPEPVQGVDSALARYISSVSGGGVLFNHKRDSIVDAFDGR